MSLHLRRVRGASITATLALCISVLVPLAVLTPRAEAAELTFSDVAAGRAHSCALTQSEYVWCWGSNNRGQLGLGDQVVATTSPMVVPGLRHVSALTAGANHTCAIVGGTTDAPDGELFCWGANNTGQLGTGTTKDAATPQQVMLSPETEDGAAEPLSGVTSVAAGRQHTCAVTDGATAQARTYCWGSNSFGQLGNGEIVDAPFRPFVSEQGQITTDDAGNLYVLDVTAGAVRMFAPTGEYLGSPGLGLVAAEAASLAVRSVDGTPTMLFVGTYGAVQWIDLTTSQNNMWTVCTDMLLSGCDGLTGVALSKDQKWLYVTGHSASGSAVGRYAVGPGPGAPVTGDPAPQWTDQPTYDAAGALVPFPLAGDAVAGPGAQGKEQVYFPLARSPLAPVVSAYGADGARIKNVNVGITSPCTDGSLADRVRGVGLSVDGEVGLAVVGTGPDGADDGTDPDVEGWCVETRDSTGALASRFGGVPTSDPGEIGTVVDVAGARDGSWFLADADHATVLKSSADGEVDFGWGHYVFRSVPQEVRLLRAPWSGAQGPITNVFVGAQHSCAVATSGGTWCWGSNDSGQIDPDDPVPQSPSGSSTFPSRATWSGPALSGDGGDGQSCVQQALGVQCWGGEYPPPYTAGATDVAVGNGFRCLVLAPDGSVTCTGPDGLEPDGQYGDGGDTCAELTGTVQTCGDVVDGATQVAAGNAHACAVFDDGASVYCWGRNSDHQVSGSDDSTVDHAVEVEFPLAPDVQLGFTGPASGAPLPAATVTFSPPVDNVTTDNVWLVGVTSPVALTCLDQEGALVDCGAGPVAAAQLAPDGVLDCGTPLTVSINEARPPAPDLVGGDQVMWGGFPLDVATSPTLAVPCPDVRITGPDVSSPDTEVLVPGKGPFVVRFQRPVDHVGWSALEVTDESQMSVPMATGGLTCRGPDGGVVDCSEGPVLRAELTPEDELPCNAVFDVHVNSGAVGSGLRWGPFELEPASGNLSVDCDGRIDPGPDTTTVSYGWSKAKARQAVGRRYLVESAAGARATYTFTGRKLTWVTVLGPDMGRARVTIDGDPVGTVDNFAKRRIMRAKWRYPGLGKGEHTVTISPLGTSRRRATGTGVAVDAFQVGRKTVKNPKPNLTWATQEYDVADFGTVEASQVRGARAVVTFDGTRLAWGTLRGPAQGTAKVVVDGVLVKTVRNYRAGATTARTVVLGNLAPGTHTATITVTGQGKGKRTGAGTFVAIDTLDAS